MSADTAALEKHQRHLEQGKSRLIDSYTEGLIDKADFDPKMTHVKMKLEQVAGQIAASKQHQAGQSELFLVINRLEEFAAAVNERLTSLDFTTKRDIIRALVKRIEMALVIKPPTPSGALRLYAIQNIDLVAQYPLFCGGIGRIYDQGRTPSFVTSQ